MPPNSCLSDRLWLCLSDELVVSCFLPLLTPLKYICVNVTFISLHGCQRSKSWCLAPLRWLARPEWMHPYVACRHLTKRKPGRSWVISGCSTHKLYTSSMLAAQSSLSRFVLPSSNVVSWDCGYNELEIYELLHQLYSFKGSTQNPFFLFRVSVPLSVALQM